MALCINDSGTYRNITTVCINDSGTYRSPNIGCINQSGTYRLFLIKLGSSYEGGFLICKQSPNLRWVVSPYSAEVSRSFHSREDANTTAQSVSGCTGWFVPTISQLQNPGYCCRSFWGPSPCYSSYCYWSSTEHSPGDGFLVRFNTDGSAPPNAEHKTFCVRAFRSVSY